MKLNFGEQSIEDVSYCPFCLIFVQKMLCKMLLWVHLGWHIHPRRPRLEHLSPNLVTLETDADSLEEASPNDLEASLPFSAKHFIRLLDIAEHQF